MSELEDDLEAARLAYVGLAVPEIATLRGQSCRAAGGLSEPRHHARFARGVRAAKLRQ